MSAIFIAKNDRPPLSLTRSRLESWSPEHLTIPEITNATALGILTTIADRVPALGDRKGWNARSAAS